MSADTSGLQLIDIQDPAAPIPLGSLSINQHAKSVTLSTDGRQAYVAAHTAGVQIVDVSRLLTSLTINAGGTTRLTADITTSGDPFYGDNVFLTSSVTIS